MSNPIEYKGLVWTPDPGEEYGQHTAEYKGHKITVISDSSGLEWDYMIDSGEYRGDFDTMHEAMREAMADVDEEV